MTNLLIDAMFQYDDPNATISSILDEVRKFVSITVIVFSAWKVPVYCYKLAKIININ